MNEGLPDCAWEHGVTFDGQGQALCASPEIHEWETVATAREERSCEANVRYRIGNTEYSGDGECGWSGTVTVHTCRNGWLWWECGRGHEHYSYEKAGTP